MSEMYSSSSGSYSNYLAQRQTDEIKKTIEKESNQQKFMYALGTGATIYGINQVGDKVDAVNASIQRMSTGIQTSLNQNTYAIAASSLLLSETFNQGFDSINNTLDLGFAGVQNSLGSMGASMTAGFDRLQKSMDYWGNEICEKLDAIHDIVNNPLLTASRELFRRATSNASKQFYEEALEDIKGAVEKNKTDYISWGLMGKIYLFGVSEFSNVVDVTKALEAFTNACKYISPDVDESDEAKKMAAEFYFYKAYTEYILFNESKISGNADTSLLDGSARDNAKSFALSDKMYEAIYNKARVLSLAGKDNEAFEEIKKVIKLDGLYAIKVLGDPDLQKLSSQIEDFLNDEKTNLFNELTTLLPFFDDYHFFDNSDFATSCAKKIQDIRNLTQTSPYLDIRYGYEFLNNLKYLIKNNSPLLIDREIMVVDLKKELGWSKLIRYALNGEIGVYEGHFVRKVIKYTYNNLFTGQITKREGKIGGPFHHLMCPSWNIPDFEAFERENYSQEDLRTIDKDIWKKIRNDFNSYCINKGVDFKRENLCNWMLIDLDSDIEETHILNLDEKTILKVIKKGRGKGAIYQPGIILKKDYEVGMQKKLIEEEKRKEELSIAQEQEKKRQEELNSDSYTLVLSGEALKGFSELDLKAYRQSNNKEDSFYIPVTVDKNYKPEDLESWKDHKPIISAKQGAVIKLRKADFERKTVEHHDGPNVTTSTVQWYRRKIPITEALLLGILTEDRNLKQQRKAAKTRKNVIKFTIIAIILIIIGVFVLR